MGMFGCRLSIHIGQIAVEQGPPQADGLSFDKVQHRSDSSHRDLSGLLSTDRTGGKFEGSSFKRIAPCADLRENAGRAQNSADLHAHSACGVHGPYVLY